MKKEPLDPAKSKLLVELMKQFAQDVANRDISIDTAIFTLRLLRAEAINAKKLADYMETQGELPLALEAPKPEPAAEPNPFAGASPSRPNFRSVALSESGVSKALAGPPPASPDELAETEESVPVRKAPTLPPRESAISAPGAAAKPIPMGRPQSPEAAAQATAGRQVTEDGYAIDWSPEHLGNGILFNPQGAKVCDLTGVAGEDYAMLIRSAAEWMQKNDVIDIHAMHAEYTDPARTTSPPAAEETAPALPYGFQRLTDEWAVTIDHMGSAAVIDINSGETIARLTNIRDERQDALFADPIAFIQKQRASHAVPKDLLGDKTPPTPEPLPVPTAAPAPRITNFTPTGVARAATGGERPRAKTMKLPAQQAPAEPKKPDSGPKLVPGLHEVKPEDTGATRIGLAPKPPSPDDGTLVRRGLVTCAGKEYGTDDLRKRCAWALFQKWGASLGYAENGFNEYLATVPELPVLDWQQPGAEEAYNLVVLVDEGILRFLEYACGSLDIERVCYLDYSDMLPFASANRRYWIRATDGFENSYVSVSDWEAKDRREPGRVLTLLEALCLVVQYPGVTQRPGEYGMVVRVDNEAVDTDFWYLDLVIGSARAKLLEDGHYGQAFSNRGVATAYTPISVMYEKAQGA